MKTVSRIVIFMLVAWALPVFGTPERPNIIFILSDDQGWADIGYHGSDIKTPNLDSLAAEGVKLNQHYVYATCSPTRVALLAGRFPSRFGVLGPLGSTTQMRPEDAHLTNGLSWAGYATHISGKWHIGETPEHRPLRYGFQTSYGYLRGQIDPYTHRYKFGDHTTWHRNDEFIDEDGHVTRLITDKAIRIIKKSGNQPFFIYIAHHAPHFPLNEPPKWIEPYKDTIDSVWRRHYAASLTHMDYQVGRIVKALERTGKRENTLIVFSSDNGGQEQWPAPDDEYSGRYAPHVSLGNNQPLRGWKGDLYDGGIRVPAFVNWPGVLPSGKAVDVPMHIVDWVPTLVKLGGGRVHDHWKLEGADLWPVLTGASRDLGERTFYWKSPRQTAVRQGDWKLVRDDRSGGVELFNLANDPNEKSDLAPNQSDRVRQLTALMERLEAEDSSPDEVIL